MTNSNQTGAAGCGCFLIPFLILVAISPILFFIYMIQTYIIEIILGPLYFIFASINVLVTDAPTPELPFSVLFFIGIILTASMFIPKIRRIYDDLPILIPLFQMYFLMLIASVIGLLFLNSWADDQIFSKAAAVFLMIITYILMRLFMSLWYFKFPISSVITSDSSASQASLPHVQMHRNLVPFSLLFTFFLFIYSVGSLSPALDKDKLMKEQISKNIAAGTILFDKEAAHDLQNKDFRISGLIPSLTRSSTTRMLIWDFDLEDLDKVQILVDGKPLHNSIVLTHATVAFTVPVPSVITIKGIQDQGGGLTYAVKFPQGRITCFNIVAMNSVNTYTLLPNP